jgi:SPX domain protein involved in polyphosphate accumulation
MSSQHPQWSEYYINYTRLKQLIYPLFDLECTVDARDCGDILESPLRDEYLLSPDREPDIKTSREFQEELNNEIQKALLFLLRTMGEIAADLSELSDEFNSLSAKVQLHLNNLELIHALRMATIDRVASKLLLLLEFIELNGR